MTTTTTASGDAIVQAGKLWEKHLDVCARCVRSVPGCTLGQAMYDFYCWIAEHEGRAR